jgi:hypothetical protein
VLMLRSLFPPLAFNAISDHATATRNHFELIALIARHFLH